MTRPDDRDPEEQLIDLLTSLDAALAEGRLADDLTDSSLPDSLRGRLHRARRCLELLARAWPAPPQSAPLPANVGRFVIERELGRGAFGIVYLAHDPVLKRPVAVKVPRLEVGLSADFRQRFQREAQAAAVLDHPNIIPVHEAGQAGAVYYIVSAYCPGPTLSAWLKEHTGPVPFPVITGLMVDLARAIQHAHERGVVHRDMKPSNVLLQAHGSPGGGLLIPKIADFGLARLMQDANELTHSRVLLGTPSYMAPEQARGRAREVGPATDVYGLGAILFELLTGQPPFHGETVLETLDLVRSAAPVPPRRHRPDVPADLETICLKCLEKEPAQRYPSAQAVADDLNRFRAGEPIRARLPDWKRWLNDWTRRPERIRDAGRFMFFYALVGLLFAVVTLISVAAGLVPSPNFNRAVAAGLSFILLAYLPMLLIGWNTMAGKGRWVLAGTVWATGMMLLAGYSAFIEVVNVGLVVSDSGQQFVDILNMCLSLGLVATHLLAWRAHLASRPSALPRAPSPAVTPDISEQRPDVVAAAAPDRGAGLLGWCRNPQRIRDAGVAMIVWGGFLLAAWCRHIFNFVSAGMLMALAPKMWVYIVVFGVNELLIFVAGLQTIRKHRKQGLWIGTIAGWTYAIWFALFFRDYVQLFYGGFYGKTLEDWSIYYELGAVLEVAAAAQAGLGVLGLYAYYWNRRHARPTVASGALRNPIVPSRAP